MKGTFYFCVYMCVDMFIGKLCFDNRLCVGNGLKNSFLILINMCWFVKVEVQIYEIKRHETFSNWQLLLTFCCVSSMYETDI